MATLTIKRVLALPAPEELSPNTVYLISKSATELQVVTVGNTTADVRSSIVGTDVDSKISAANSAQTAALQGYADAAAAAAQAAAEATAAAGDTATLNAAKAYADAGDTATLNAAKSYADGAVSTAIGNLDLSNSAVLAADIAARDALELTKNSFVLVSDATGDATVDVGAALYFYNVADDTWLKIAEYESLDIVIPNKAILENFGEVDGELWYNDAPVATVQAGVHEW